METRKLYINNEWVDSKSGKYIEVENPYTREIIGRVAAGNEEDVDIAVAGAKEALKTWQFSPIEKRIEAVQHLVDYFKDHKEEIVNTIIDELGSVVKFTASVHFDVYISNVEDFIRLAKEFKFEEKIRDFNVYKEPVGVVACITPWNFPLGQITKKVVPALLMGNTIVLKPSQKTPLTGLYFAEALEGAGLPKGVFQLVTGRGREVGNALALHPDVNMLSFTGSTSGGKELMSLGIGTVKRNALELGGKSASIILEDADLRSSIKATMDNVFPNAGQACSSKTRMLLPRSLKEEARDLIIELAGSYKYGDPRDPENDYGPVQSDQAFDKILSYIEYGKEHYEALFEGKIDKDHRIFGPFVFDDVDNSSKIAQEEIFGPVLCVIYYDTVEEAIDIANDSIYGLHGMVFGDTEKAVEVAKRIKTGQIQINNAVRTHDAPFGGYKQSGIGREGSKYAFDEYVEIKTLFIK